ncbi:MAG: hypothetical protein EBR82_50585, partial [Caulobacteraceae bacterium]|nr:hypothetical protein [Caulobacteraceae bacterium]
EIPAYLVWRPNDRLLEGVVIGNSPEAWIRAYSGEEPPPPMSTMRTIGQTMNTRKAPGASFPAFETFAAWDTTDKRLFAKLVRDSRVCVVTREPGSEDTIEYKCKEAVAKVCFEKVKKSFTVPPETVDQWELPHIEVFWQALMAEDTSLGKYRTGK